MKNYVKCMDKYENDFLTFITFQRYSKKFRCSNPYDLLIFKFTSPARVVKQPGECSRGLDPFGWWGYRRTQMENIEIKKQIPQFLMQDKKKKINILLI